MKTVWIASLAMAAFVPAAHAQSTIYKHVDESGRVTYSNRPMKGATVLDLEPLNTIPGAPVAPVTLQPAAAAPAVAAAQPAARQAPIDFRPPEVKPVAIVTPLPRTTLAAIEPQVQKRRDEDRRKILQEELTREEESLVSVRESLTKEQHNPTLVAAVRAAQQAENPTPSQMAEFRLNIDKASGRIRGLQATVAEHEKNIEALKKELGAMKP